MNQLEITQQYVTYQSQTKLVELAQQVATSRSKTKPPIKEAIQVGTQIRLGLEALNYSQFLTKAQIDEILYLLSDIASINAFPFAPTVNSVQLPTILLGVPGQQGPQGIQGVTGGGFPFLVSNISTDTVVDQFPITLCGAASWTYDVHDAGNKRVETITGCWLSDGSQVRDDGGVTLDPEIGTTVGKISFYVNFAGGNIQLIAHVTSGNWTVAGSRIQIPVNGNGITLPSSLTNDTIWIGSPANNPVEWPITGDISLSNVGVTAINAGVIVNADINASAAIDLTKLAALTANRAVVTNSLGFLTTSLTTDVQVGYLSNVTSDIQAQINNKLTVSLGAAATGDILYYNGINWTNFARGTAGQLLSSNGTTISWISGGSGITNTALNNEMMKSNGVNAVGASMYSTSLGDLILGAPAQAGGARNLSVQGSAGNINLFVQSKGNGGISFYDEVFNNYLNTSKSNFAAVYSILGELQLKSALTSTVGDPLRVTVSTSGTPVIGIGTGIEFATQVSGVSTIVGSVIQSVTTNVAGGGTFDFVFLNSTNGAAPVEHVRIKSTGDILLTGSGITSTINSQGWTGGIANTFVQIKGADAAGVRNGGLIQLYGGGTGQGSVNIASGDSIGSGFDTSSITLTTGNGTVGNASAGNINLASGVPIGTGTEGSVNIQTRGPLSKISFFNVTPVIKQAAVTTAQGIANVLTAYGLLPISTIVGASFTNTAVNNELIMSDGVNGVSSRLFGDTNGDLTFGSPTTAGNSRSLVAAGSGSNIGLSLNAKGSFQIGINADLVILTSNSAGYEVRWNATNSSSPGFLVNKLPLSGSIQPFQFTAAAGIGGNINGQDFNILAGQAITNGNAGSVSISSGAGNGTGVNGNVTITTNVGGSGGGGFVVLQPTGRFVGIGTVTPVAKLDIITSSEDFFSSGIRIQRSGVATQFGLINYSGGSLNLIATNSTGGGAFTFFSRSDNGTSVITNMVIDNLGRVGIGTSLPSVKLAVRDNTTTVGAIQNYVINVNRQNSDTPALYFGVDGNADAVIASNGANLRIGKDVSGTFSEYIRVNTSGNVGIGTTTPAVPLSVNGTARVNGSVQAWTGAGTDGACNLALGNSTTTGYVEWIRPSQLRTAYLGFDTTTDLTLNLQNTANFVINGGALQIAGAANEVRWASNAGGNNRIYGQGGGGSNEFTMKSRFDSIVIDAGESGNQRAITFRSAGLNMMAFAVGTFAVTINSLAGSGVSTVTANAGGTLGRTTAFTIDLTDNIVLEDGKSIFTGLLTGNTLAGSALQKLAFWGKTPIVQPTTAVVAAARVAVGGGVIQVNDTYGGYSIGQIAAALRASGILA